MFDASRAGAEFEHTPGEFPSGRGSSPVPDSGSGSARLGAAARDRLCVVAADTGEHGERPLTAVTQELCELASQLAVDTCRWLELLAEFDRREGWAGVGIRSCAQWLSWRCALSLTTAYEHLRVAHALENLPFVRAEFSAGRLSYSKVRAITRMTAHTSAVGGARAGTATSTSSDQVASAGDADPDSGDVEPGGVEESVLRIARSCTAAQLDRLARGYRRAITTEEEIERSGGRSFSWHWDDDGYLVVQGRLPPEEGATLLAALRAASDHLEESSAEESPAGLADPDRPHWDTPTVDLPRTPPVLQPAQREGSPISSAEESAVTHTTLASQPPQPAAESGMQPRPEPRPRPATQPLSLISYHTPDQLSSPTDDPGLLRRADTCARDARAADALVLLAETTLTHTPAHLNGDDRYRVMLHVDLDTLALADRPGSDQAGEQATPTARTHIDDGPALSVTAARRITCHAGVVAVLRGPRGQLLDIGRRTRTIPSAIARALHLRDSGCCRFPGCHRRSGLEAHHIRHWARGGPTSLDNLVLLCRLHHWLLHEGGFTVEAPVIGHATFRRPDGQRLPQVPALAALPGPAMDRTLRNDADSLTPPWWYGEPLRLAYVVSALLDEQDRRSDLTAPSREARPLPNGAAGEGSSYPSVILGA